VCLDAHARLEGHAWLQMHVNDGLCVHVRVRVHVRVNVRVRVRVRVRVHHPSRAICNHGQRASTRKILQRRAVNLSPEKSFLRKTGIHEKLDWNKRLADSGFICSQREYVNKYQTARLLFYISFS